LSTPSSVATPTATGNDVYGVNVVTIGDRTGSIRSCPALRKVSAVAGPNANRSHAAAPAVPPDRVAACAAAPAGALPVPAPSCGSAPRTGVGARAVAATAPAPVADPPASPDLTVNKVIAGAGAAATSAVVGSFFGAAGTVLGAALGSVVSMIATTIYQHSLDRTRDTVKARIKLPGGRTVDVAGKVEVPAPRVAAADETGRARVYVTPTGLTDQPTAVLSAVSPASPPRPRRRWVVRTALTVGVFLIGLLAVTGVELLKGSTLARGETGTSVGRVVDPQPVSADTTESTETAESTATTETSTTEPTDEATEPTATDESNSDAERGADATTDAPQRGSSSDEGDHDATSPVTPTPTRAPSGG
jgi:hypothetical protein